MLDFGEVVASAFDSATKTLRVAIQEIGNKPLADQEIWGHPAIIYCPAAPTSGGKFTAMFTRQGDELVAFAARETRWQREMQPGEVAVRGFGPNAAWVILKPNGDVVMESTGVLIGSSGAAHPIPKGDALLTWLAAHTHVVAGTVTTGAGSGGVVAATAAASALATTGISSTKHKIDG